MSLKKTARQIKADAIAAAKNYKVNKASHDYKAGYAEGVKNLALLVEITRTAALMAAEESQHDKTVVKVMLGYAQTLGAILEASDSLIPPEYDMAP